MLRYLNAECFVLNCYTVRTAEFTSLQSSRHSQTTIAAKPRVGLPNIFKMNVLASLKARYFRKMTEIKIIT